MLDPGETADWEHTFAQIFKTLKQNIRCVGCREVDSTEVHRIRQQTTGRPDET